jgi:hypothetical protein
MRQPLKGNPSRAATAQSRSIPAPTGGWDAYNSIASMPVDSAVILDNVIPRSGYCELRRGFVEQSTGAPSQVNSLIPWRGGAPGSDKLFAAAGTAIYDASTAGTALTVAFSPITSDIFQYVSFANPAGAFTIAVNGADAPLHYDGATWTPVPAITGSDGPITLNPDNLFNVMANHGRLFFAEKNTLHVWYLAAAAIGGAATLLDLGSIFTKGGSLSCISTWSIDGGQGADDFAVFGTNQGQVAIYQGTDPNQITEWSLIGVFDLGMPLSQRSLIKYGSDLVLLTTDGVVPLSQALKLDRSQVNDVALTSKIRDAFSTSVQSFGSQFGWDGILYAKGSLGIFNIPNTPVGANSPTSMQYVQNMITGAWCRFLDMNALCWETANGNAYFGGVDGVYQWDVGSDDNGDYITWDVKTAFSNFGVAGRLKLFTMVRALLKCSPLIQPAIEIDTDYREAIPTAVPTVIGAGDVSPNDINNIRYDWAGAAAEGYVAAVRMRGQNRGDPNTSRIAVGDGSDLSIDGVDDVIERQAIPFEIPVQLIGFDVMFKIGGML